MQDQPQSVPVKSKNGSFQLSTDDAHLATVLSNSTFNDVTPQDSQIGRASSEAAPVNLRQRSKAPAAALLPDNTHALTPEQLADHLHESPFIDTESCMTPYEWVKFVVLLPWLLFRIVVAIPLLIVAWSSTALLVAGVPVNTALVKWRKKVVSVYMWFWANLLIRLGLNFFDMRVRGKEHIAEAERVRPIIVFNHVSYLDGIVMASIFAPSGVAKASVAQMPFFGVFTRALQFLFVRRKGTTDEQNPHIFSGDISTAIAERSADPRFSLFIIAPEGTTKHRHCLIHFARGAFVTGRPVMPVLLKYRSTHFNLGWGIVYTAWHFFRMCQQFINHLEVEILPIYMPSPEEQKSPELYAHNVRELMGRRLGAELSRHGIKDQQALKANGIYVDWTGRYVRQRRHGQSYPTHVKAAPPQGDSKSL